MYENCYDQYGFGPPKLLPPKSKEAGGAQQCLVPALQNSSSSKTNADEVKWITFKVDKKMTVKSTRWVGESFATFGFEEETKKIPYTLVTI